MKQELCKTNKENSTIFIVIYSEKRKDKFFLLFKLPKKESLPYLLLFGMIFFNTIKKCKWKKMMKRFFV